MNKIKNNGTANVENSVEFPPKLKIELPIIEQFHLWVHI